ncbi:MAG: hypothetical protein IPG50_00235 [Myxococcales bacterium]|nr:hypothetical protein [Myxococcales bacterium]
MLRTRPLVAALVSLSLGLLALAVACSSQAEGDRCQLDSDRADKTNEDCADGLVCIASKDLPLAPEFRGQVSDREGRCCPSDRSRATVDVCRQPPPTPGGDAAIPAEGGSTADASTDSSVPGADAGPDAAPDGGSVDGAVNDAASSDAGPADASDAG